MKFLARLCAVNQSKQHKPSKWTWRLILNEARSSAIRPSYLVSRLPVDVLRWHIMVKFTVPKYFEVAAAMLKEPSTIKWFPFLLNLNILLVKLYSLHPHSNRWHLGHTATRYYITGILSTVLKLHFNFTTGILQYTNLPKFL